ncbi:MAG: tetratricopeptide repeat protein [Candidatus Korobacteraceae bacterium]
MNSLGLKTDATIQSQPGTSWFASSSRQNAVLSLVLVLVTAALYFPVHSYPFVNYDDTLYVTQNAHVQDGLTWDTVRWAFTTYHVGTWHPLTWLSHALDCQLFDLGPAGPHDVNLMLHVLNVVLLFWVLQRATGFSGRSFMVAALFALHPINVESVVWIAERKNSLSMLFFLLALGAYRWYTADRKASRYALVAVLFALGLMAKPQVITFPFVLLLWDYWPLRRLALRSSLFAFRQKDSHDVSGERRRAKSEKPPSEWPGLLLEKLPLFALAAISAAVTMSAQRADATKAWYPLGLRAEYALVSYVEYIGKALWPARLSAFYPHPDYVPLWQAAAAALFLALVTAATIALRRRCPYLLVGWLFFLGTLVPMLGFEGVGYQGRQGVADRYAYLPFIGLFIMICWGVAEWAAQKRLPAALLRSVSVAVLLVLGAVAYRQLGYWRDNVTLWSHAVQVTDGNFLAENNLGKALLAEGRTEEGVSHFYKAVAIYPDDPVGNLNIGIYEQKRGNFSAAIARYKKTISLTRDPELKAAAWNNMAAAYRRLGDFANAQRSQDAAAKLRH